MLALRFGAWPVILRFLAGGDAHDFDGIADHGPNLTTLSKAPNIRSMVRDMSNSANTSLIRSTMAEVRSDRKVIRADILKRLEDWRDRNSPTLWFYRKNVGHRLHLRQNRQAAQRGRTGAAGRPLPKRGPCARYSPHRTAGRNAPRDNHSARSLDNRGERKAGSACVRFQQ